MCCRNNQVRHSGEPCESGILLALGDRGWIPDKPE
jgi:hypothetical protein